MHLDFAGADAFSVKVELHVGMLGEQAHGHRRIGDALADHERCQPLAERIVMIAGLPDRDFFGLPCFVWAD